MRKNTGLWRNSADGEGGDMFPQLHMLLPGCQEVCDPPADGVWYILLEILSWNRVGIIRLNAKLTPAG